MNYINKLMADKNISMYRLSKLTGIPKTTINDICSGKTAIERCSAIYLKKIAEVLDCRMEELLMGRDFNTNIIIGKSLKNFVSGVHDYKKRDCFSRLEKYINSTVKDRVCVIYGLRRTGKTTMIRQMIEQMPQDMFDKTAYIKLNSNNRLSDLNKDLDKLYELGFKYIFMDEITLLKDFIDCASLFSDIYTGMGMRIVLSGTDSLGFFFTSENELYDRTFTIHTTYIPFAEHSRLLGTDDIDQYIQYGGTLRLGETDFDDDELFEEGVSFRDDESTRRYIDTAIAKNIQNSLSYYKYGSHFRNLYDLYEKKELTNAINRIIEDMNHRFAESVIVDEFESHDLGSARKNLLKKGYGNIEERMEKEHVLEKMMHILDIKKNKEALQVKHITPAHIEEIQEFLRALELTHDMHNLSISDKGMLTETEYTIFSQPGMRYAQAQSLIYSLMKDETFQEQDFEMKNLICERILDDVRGRMLEDIVLLDTDIISAKNEEVFKLRFANGEFDMVIYNKDTHSCSIFEIKHSGERDDRQFRHLINPKFMKLTEDKFGKIKNKIVLYRGESVKLDNEIAYINVNEYLKNIHQKSIDETLA